MKILPISDTHLDMTKDEGMSVINALGSHSDITLIIAGDLSEHHLVPKLLEEFCSRWERVIYVPGNHDYWHTSLLELDNTLRDLENQIDNLHVLIDDVLEIDGVRFLGGTLWFEHTPYSVIHGAGWCDFINILDSDADIYQRNQRTKWFLEQNLSPGDIVITHHLPSFSSVNKKFQGASLNVFYANRLDNLIEETKPALWIHGHGHDSNDYFIGNTRILSNPLGYPHDVNPNFSSKLIIEV